jgi:hypothetical protein
VSAPDAPLSGVVSLPPSGRSGGGGVARSTMAHAIIAVVVLASGGVLVSTGSPVAAALPAALAVGAYLLARLPVRYPLLAFTGLWIVSDMLPRPLSASGGIWKSPFYGVSNFLGNNLDTVLGISALRFSGSEAVFVILLAVVGIRWLSGDPIDAEGRIPFPNFLGVVLAATFVTVLLLELRGIGAGGDFRQSLWQFRQVLWLPVLALLFAAGLRGSRDVVPLAVLLTVASVVKIAIGLYYLRRIAAPNGLDVDVMTCHEDSMTFVTTAMLWLAAWAHRPSWKRAGAAILIGGWALIGMAANERRLAYVSLGVSLALLFVMLRGPVRRAIVRALLYGLPLIVVYLAAGRHRNTGLFKPAALIMSVAQQKDESSKTRDVENFNLLQTLKQNKVVGAGWGHEYDEQVKADDISHLFAQYRFIAHNSVLWLLSIGGVIGFTLLWLPVVVGIFLARRGYLFARTPLERTAAFTALIVMVSFVNQAWGDMGTQGETCTVMMAWALAVAGKLAVETGAFPARVALWGRRRPTVGRSASAAVGSW